MRNHFRARRGVVITALLPLPLLAAVTIWFGVHGTGEPPSVRGPSTGLSFGQVDVRAELLPAPAMGQMMMPMDSSSGHDDEIQVVLALRNDTGSPVTVPFDRVHVVDGDGHQITATAGLLGELVLRPHASAEERLRFPAQAGNHVELAIPDRDRELILRVPVGLPAGAAPPTTSSHQH
jgi:hypothetical protein